MKQKADKKDRNRTCRHINYVWSVAVCVLMAVSMTAQGKSVDPQRAAEIARRYVTLSHHDVSKARARAARGVSATPYYIYNDAQGRGFVVVAGDDAMGEVLAYGTEGALDTLSANPCVRLLLDGYRQTFEVLREAAVPAQKVRRAAQYTKTVSPLLKSKWGQSHPFNAMTGYPYSGCVATAVEQMMYYYRWPAQGQGSNEYTVTYYNTVKSADFSQSHYDWSNMLPDYRYPVRATETQENAVALLMNDVGVASFMQYTPSASGTQGVFAYQALQKHFDYTSAYVTKAVEGPTRFAEILRQELLNGCPVYLEGRPAGSASGHAWVADGFDENGLFHMNFGWEGQGDAYYSLVNLNLSQTGSEFQGKPLAFNRAITAILAHPNNGKYPPIDRALLASSPQLMFNEGGALTLQGVTDKVFDASQTLIVEMNSFVNRGNPFRGDIGVAVYDEHGSIVRVAYSDDHATGGFTQRVYGADHAGFMGVDYLMNQAQPIKLSLAALSDGYYRLVPVCAALKDDGTWDEFFPIKKAPIIEVELTGSVGRVAEMCAADAHFQLMAQPRLVGSAEQGRRVQAFFSVKNLNGVPRDCYMRVQLVDAANAVVLDTRVDEATEIEGFTEVEIPIALTIPAHLAPSRYEVRLLMSADEAETQSYPINNIHDTAPAYIDVVKAPERPLMAKVEPFLADDAGDRVESGSIDISNMSVFKLGVTLRTSENQSYDGRVAMYCEDVESGERQPVKGLNDLVTVYSSFDVPLYSYWLRKNDVPWADSHTYRVMVMGQIDGEEVELKSPQQQACYLKREGDVLTLYYDVPTGIGSAATVAAPFSIRREGDRLTVTCRALRGIKLYSADGRLLRHVSSADACHATLSLQGVEQGVCLLRVEAEAHCHIYRFIHDANPSASR